MARRYLIFTAALIMAILSIQSPLWAGPKIFNRAFLSGDSVPDPRLLYPTTDEVDITGKEYLEFRWSPHEGDPIIRDHYDFRLYRGYEMLASTLIYKQNVEQNVYSIRIKAELFRDGEVYTWSLRQVYTGSEKSRRSYQPFKIIKKAG